MRQTTFNDKRFTTHNKNRTTTCGNHILIVTLPTAEFNKIGRYGVFNDAMRMLGNKSEYQLLEQEPITENEINDMEISFDEKESAKILLEYIRQIELEYRKSISKWCQGWEIEIIGEMPKQIGSCRYEGTS